MRGHWSFTTNAEAVESEALRWATTHGVRGVRSGTEVSGHITYSGSGVALAEAVATVPDRSPFDMVAEFGDRPLAGGVSKIPL